jgi:hypothetical protein|tara:strand:+ start:446 stop:967 length:522 start_codon:yes stop_codon:yes gene_type:complete
MIFNLKIFLNILLFSNGPQDLPASANLLKIIIILNIIVGLMAVDPNIDITVNIFFALIYIFVTLLFIRICLNIKDKSSESTNYSSRYLQVCIGMLGVHALVALFTNLITMGISSPGEPLVIVFLIISLYAWFVNGHILKNAFDTSMTIGLGFSLLHSMVCVIFMMIFIQVLAS